MGKPTAVPKTLICSECGLSWEAHMKGRKTAPGLDVCVRLLKVELSKRSAASWIQATSSARPFYAQGLSG